MAADADVHWVALKNQLPPDMKWGLARDKSTTGAKMFAAFQTREAAIAYLEAHRGEALHELLLTDDVPCWLFLDVDSHKPESYTERIIPKLLESLADFIEESCGVEITWVPGENCQVATAASGKASVHFVGYLLCPKLKVLKHFAFRYTEYIYRNNVWELLYITEKPESERLLERLDIKSATLKYFKCAVDAGIYTNFRSYRALSMEKLGRGNYLTPACGSSAEIKDHLVGYAAGVSPTPVGCLPLSVEVMGDYAGECGGGGGGGGRGTRFPPRTFVKTAPLTEMELNIIQKKTEFVQTDEAIREKLGGRPIVVRYHYPSLDDTGYILVLDQGYVCPFAERVHKSNRLYFKVHAHSIVFCGCFDQECASSYRRLPFIHYSEEALRRDRYDAMNPDRLHLHEKSIKWLDVYTEEVMRPYPLSEIVCVRANMGVGKTEGLQQLFARHLLSDPCVKALVVTFSRALAAQYARDFADFGFISYMDTDADCIKHNRVICCLDSLYRIGMRNPELLIIDESLSVFLHFSSPLIKRPTEVSLLCELLIYQAKYTYLIDAMVDHIGMRNIVDHFERQKRVTATWVWNQYVRPTNRRAKIYTAPAVQAARRLSFNPIAISCINHCIRLIREGKKVVVCSSTKRFTNLLYDRVRSEFPGKRVLLYNSDVTSGAKKVDAAEAGAGVEADAAGADADAEEEIVENDEPMSLRDPKKSRGMIDTTIWGTADVLIYSPSVSAGVSFHLPHYHQLIAYLVNSTMTPTVDAALQQIFRVRQLLDGDMSLYIADTHRDSDIPICESDIERELDDSTSVVNKYYMRKTVNFNSEMSLKDGRIVYDRERVSYDILKLILIIRFRSLHFFVRTIERTLTEDYKIPVTFETLIDPIHKGDQAILAELENGGIVKPPPWDPRLVPNKEDYLMLKALADPSDLDKLAMRLHDLIYEHWKVPLEKVDEAFYTDYILHKDAYQKIYTVHRLIQVLKYSTVEIQHQFAERLDILTKSGDLNIAFYKQRFTTYYVKMIFAAQLMDGLFGKERGVNGWREQLKSSTFLMISNNVMEERFTALMDTMAERERKELYRTFEVTAKSTDFIKIKKILSKTFNMEIERESNSMKTEKYNNIIINYISLKKHLQLYGSGLIADIS